MSSRAAPVTSDHVVPADPMRSRRSASAWTAVATVLLLVASVAGLLLDDPYAADPATTAMLRAYDLVTLVVVVPVLALTPRWARSTAALARLVPAAMLAAVAYTYCYHLLATPLHDLFLVHAAVVGTAAIALVVHVSAMVPQPGALGSARGQRTTAAALGLLTLGLAGLWAFVALDNAVTGAAPTGSALVESDAVVRLGMALDLVLLVPLYGAAAVLLWRRAAWGYVLGGIALLSGLVHQLGYVVAMPFQVAADVPGAVAGDPLEPVIVLLYLLGLWSFVRSLRRAPASQRHPTWPFAD